MEIASSALGNIESGRNGDATRDIQSFMDAVQVREKREKERVCVRGEKRETRERRAGYLYGRERQKEEKGGTSKWGGGRHWLTRPPQGVEAN